MTVTRVSEMTIGDLQAMIDQAIDRRLQEILKPVDARSAREINESIRHNRWTPPLGTPSTLELLREDRDR